MTPFFISRIRASHWKYPLFAKMGTSVVYVLVGSGRAGKIVHVTEDIIVQGEMS